MISADAIDPYIPSQRKTADRKPTQRQLSTTPPRDAQPSIRTTETTHPPRLNLVRSHTTFRRPTRRDRALKPLMARILFHALTSVAIALLLPLRLSASGSDTPPCLAKSAIVVKLDQRIIDQTRRAIKVLTGTNTPPTCTPDPSYILISVNTDTSTATLCTDGLTTWTVVTGPFIDLLTNDPNPLPAESYYGGPPTLDLTTPQPMSTSWFSDYIAGFQISKSATDKNGMDKPAQFQWTKGTNTSDSWATDVAVSIVGKTYPFGMALGKPNEIEPQLSGEYHRQTLTNQEQNTILAGISALDIWGKSTDFWAHYFSPSAKYKNDRVKSTEGLQTTLDYIPLVRLPYIPVGIASGLGWLFRDDRWDEWLRFLWQPTVGIDYEGVYTSPSPKPNGPPKSPTGNILRGYGDLQVALYPAGGESLLSDRLALTVELSGWGDALATNGIDKGNHTSALIQTGVAYYFDKKQHVGVGVEYVSGANPRENLPKQTYYQASFRLKWGP